MIDKMCWPSKEGVKCLPHYLSSGYMNGSICISNLLNTNLDLIMQQRNVVNDCGSLITLPRATRWGGFSFMYNTHLSESPVSGSFPEGSTQLSFVLT